MKKYRTLVRINEIFDEYISVIVPGWDAKQNILLRKDQLPSNIQEVISKEKRLHAQANLKADYFNELNFSDWEES